MSDFRSKRLFFGLQGYSSVMQTLIDARCRMIPELTSIKGLSTVVSELTISDCILVLDYEYI
jgi:hypothetical protein